MKPYRSSVPSGRYGLSFLAAIIVFSSSNGCRRQSVVTSRPVGSPADPVVFTVGRQEDPQARSPSIRIGPFGEQHGRDWVGRASCKPVNGQMYVVASYADSTGGSPPRSVCKAEYGWSNDDHTELDLQIWTLEDPIAVDCRGFVGVLAQFNQVEQFLGALPASTTVVQAT